MSKEGGANNRTRERRSLKLREPSISPSNPWEDDALDRQKVSEALTSLVVNEPDSLVISLSGGWGTGKTFLLQRWQEELKARESGEVITIYFNAWEDDFCDDPLVAIIGQMSENLGKSKYKSMIEKVVDSAKPLFTQSLLAALKAVSGVSFDQVYRSLLNTIENSALEQYAGQRKTKEALKETLRDLSDEVKRETCNPLVFIIDELDRCRPTFAVELLERVKHIFDIPNMIFVFGINREDLCSSVSSIYGEIKSDVYLRRFFDMEFMLPKPDTKSFCEHLIKKYDIESIFSELRQISNRRIHGADFATFSAFFPYLCSRFDLSLRDVDYCIRSIILVGNSVKVGHSIYPFLISVMIILRLKNKDLYQRFICDECLGSEVMNYVYEVGKFGSFEEIESEVGTYMDVLEIYLYLMTDSARYPGINSEPSFQELLSLFDLKQKGGRESEPLEYLSKRTLSSSLERVERLHRLMDEERRRDHGSWRINSRQFSEMLELAAVVVQK